jgi:hypothetical protein
MVNIGREIDDNITVRQMRFDRRVSDFHVNNGIRGRTGIVAKSYLVRRR